MNGAQALIESLHAAGVTMCFANPGTSEIHLVAALEETPGMRGVLCLFEGVATGAADGFGRMAPVPAAALLHQGAGLANGLANLHNAKRAGTPVVTIVGDGASSHRGLGAPLESDVAAVAASVSQWVRTASSAATVGADAVAAVNAAAGGVATLIVPSDVAWSSGGQPAHPGIRPGPRPVPSDTVTGIARVIERGCETVSLLLGGPALRAAGLAAADRIAQATGALILAEAFPSRLERGVGVPAITRVSADPVTARRQLAGTRQLILAGAADPVTAFAAPGVPGRLVPAGCESHDLGVAAPEVLLAVADLLAPNVKPRRTRPQPRQPCPADAPLTPTTVAETVGALLPEAAIVVDEANTCGAPIPAATAASARHDLLSLCGFAIGQGLPLSIGAALACPDRPVVCLQADGSAMYTMSALWTQAREGLDITTVLLNNRGYAILRREAARTLGAEAAVVSSPLFDLSGPDLDFVSLSQGMGVAAGRAHTVGELTDHLKQAFAEPGPHLIDASIAVAE